MATKLTSYQKLKEANKYLSDKVYRLLHDKEYLVTELMTVTLTEELGKQIERQVMFGDNSDPSGKIEFYGLLDALLPDK